MDLKNVQRTRLQWRKDALTVETDGRQNAHAIKIMFYTLRDVNFTGKRVLVRVDFNVPLENGKITDDTRIKAALPTIEYLISKNAKVILMSHLGRPDGKIVPSMSLKAVSSRLAKLLDRKVQFADDCVGDSAKNAVDKLKNKDVLLLENLRFHAEEEKNDSSFAKQLASLGDIYINDAFGTAHRAHSSTVGICDYLPSAAGFLMEKEINELSVLLSKPKRPFVVVLGGVKVSDKIGVIRKMLEKADAILIGGAMCFTFLKASGKRVGKSIVENDKIAFAKEMLDKGFGKIVLPVDVIVSDSIQNPSYAKQQTVFEMRDDLYGLDIGHDTIEVFKPIIKEARTVFWNGPMGLFEKKQFAKGTEEVAEAMSFNKHATTVIGGGDTVSAIDKLGLTNKFTLVSTGGGATLEFMEGKTLPGIAALEASFKKGKIR